MALIETIIALALLYALLSIVASALKELLEAAAQKRKKDLKGAIEDLLGVTGAQKFFDDSRIRTINALTGQCNVNNIKDWPSYVEPDIFAEVARTILSEVPNCKLARAIQITQNGISDDIKNIKLLYQQRMERLIGSFKRNAQWWLLGIGFALAAATDADTIYIARTLNNNVTTRVALVNLSESVQDANRFQQMCGKKPEDTQTISAASMVNCMQDAVPSVLGWSKSRRSEVLEVVKLTDISSYWHLIFAVVGYLLTAIAISMGSPFWFDVISKVSNVRSTLRPVDEESNK